MEKRFEKWDQHINFFDLQLHFLPPSSIASRAAATALVFLPQLQPRVRVAYVQVFPQLDRKERR